MLGKTMVRKHLRNVLTIFGFVSTWSQVRAAFPSLNLCVHVCPVVSDSVILWTVAPQAPLSMRFSRQEY